LISSTRSKHPLYEQFTCYGAFAVSDAAANEARRQGGSAELDAVNDPLVIRGWRRPGGIDL
jgi:hypothetical protein